MPLQGSCQCLVRLGFVCALLLVPCKANAQLVVEGPHPLASGRYQFRVGGKQVGFEDWKSFYTRDAFILSSRAKVSEPAIEYQFRLTMGRDFSPTELEIELTMGGQKLTGSYEFSAEEAHQVVTGAQSRSERRVRLPAGYRVDFGSPLFNYHTIHGQSFPQGEPRMLDVLFVAMPSLAATATQQTYTYLGNELLDRKKARVDARHFRFDTFVDGQIYAAEIWTDPEGLPLLIRRGSGASLEETELTEMEIQPRRMPK